MVATTMFFLLAMLMVAPRAFGEECPGPVSFNSSSFTIRGPCPNDTVLVAVGSTIQYRCDYIDRTIAGDSPYWYIPGLSDIPFLAGQGSEYGITVISDPGAQGHTTVDIPVKEQYLNNTLTIQCGLCSGEVCYSNGNSDRLSQNITSTSVTLVAFGSPSNLQHTPSATGSLSELILSWSIPPVSSDYTGPVNFIYELTLTNSRNSTQSVLFTTDTTTTTINKEDIPVTFDKCSNYTWSVMPMAGEYKGGPVISNKTIFFPSTPQVSLQSVNFNFTECTSSQKASIEFEVHSCPSGGRPQSNITVMADTEYRLSNIEMIAFDGFGTFSVQSEFTVFENFVDYEGNITVEITVSNDYGSAVTTYDVEENINIVTCVSVPIVSSTVTPTRDTTINSIYTSSSHSSSSFISRDTPSSSPTVSVFIDPVSTGSNKGWHIYLYIFIPLVFVIVVLVLCIVLGVLLFYYTKKKKASMKVTSETEYASIENQNLAGKKKAFMNGNGNSVFKYENVSISTCSTPMDINTPRLPLCSTTTTDSDQQSQEEQTRRDPLPQPSDDQCGDGLYATPMDFAGVGMIANGRTESNPTTHLMNFPINNNNTKGGGMDNPNYGKAMPGGSSLTEEAVYSIVNPSMIDPPPATNNGFVDMPGYSEVHIDPIKQRRSWHNTRVNSTPKHSSCSSLPATPLHIKLSSQNPPVFLKLGGIEETDGGTSVNKTATTIVTDDDAVYDDITFDKENIQEDGGTGSHPQYVAVEEIKKRKMRENQFLRFSDDMIELKELPPPTPKRDPVKSPSSATPTSPSATPPPVPPHPLSPSISTTS